MYDYYIWSFRWFMHVFIFSLASVLSPIYLLPTVMQEVARGNIDTDYKL